jgi:hypothetical protein
MATRKETSRNYVQYEVASKRQSIGQLMREENSILIALSACSEIKKRTIYQCEKL